MCLLAQYSTWTRLAFVTRMVRSGPLCFLNSLKHGGKRSQMQLEPLLVMDLVNCLRAQSTWRVTFVELTNLKLLVIWWGFALVGSLLMVRYKGSLHKGNPKSVPTQGEILSCSWLPYRRARGALGLLSTDRVRWLTRSVWYMLTTYLPSVLSPCSLRQVCGHCRSWQDLQCYQYCVHSLPEQGLGHNSQAEGGKWRGARCHRCGS